MNKKEFWRAVKFVLFSISAGVIQVVSFTILQELVIKDVTQPYGWSYFISLTLSVVWNFTFNRKFTFKSANNVPIAMLKVLGYYVVFTPVSIFGGIALVNLGWNPYLVLAISMVVNFVTEYIFDSLVVFRNSIDTNDIAQKQAQKKRPNGRHNGNTNGRPTHTRVTKINHVSPKNANFKQKVRRKSLRTFFVF